ncbi:MAG: methylmalonyl-CoA decarboxylase subunit alpha [Solirubrobacteraceae bacterium]|jgi:acetyl-CoA carboxylase carboxyltransferase component|nr:methylmalonyl-CoA decarboxylase subunit alpha [Solirubrobacteraceae bacterium]
MSAVFDVAPEHLVARARLELLFDSGTFRPTRSMVGDGVLAGSGRVNGRVVCAWAQDGAFKGGSLGTRGGETIARTIQRADGLGVPVVGFPHSGGARLQEGVAALHAYSAIFRAQALATVPQISVIGGPCAGGAAYSPALGDLTIMAGSDAKMFLTGPAVVEKVTRERVTALELGGPKIHGRNGVAHLVADHDVHAAELVRSALAHLPSQVGGPLPLHPPADPVPGDPADVLPAREREVYDVRDVAARLVDGGELLELGPRWARNLVVGFARIEGMPVGVIANQPKYLGGCLDAESSQKGAWFVDLCDRFGLPLVVLVDTPGFLPGVSQEQAGVIRHGASLLRAFGVATTPRVTLTMRQAYGGAHIVMNSRDLGADLTLAWPHAKIGVMGPSQAVEVVNRREIAAGADAQALADAYAAEHLPVRVAASRGFIDEIVAPSETRERIAFALESAR